MIRRNSVVSQARIRLSGSAFSCAGRDNSPSLVGKCQIIQINGVGSLLRVSVHLIVDRDAPPAGGSAAVTVGPVQGTSYAVESDGLVLELIAGSACNLKRQVIPGVVVWVAGNAGGNPFRVNVVPNLPLVPVSDETLVAPDEAHAVKELVDVELQRLGGSEVRAVKVHVVSEVLVRIHLVMIGIGHALRGEIADQVIVKQGVTVSGGPADVVFGRLSTHGRGFDVLGHGVRDSIARGRRTVNIVRGNLSVS